MAGGHFQGKDSRRRLRTTEGKGWRSGFKTFPKCDAVNKTDPYFSWGLLNHILSLVQKIITVSSVVPNVYIGSTKGLYFLKE